jgi:hypothetical protein
MDVEIPKAQVTDTGEMQNMVSLKNRLNKKGISLEDACHHFGISCEHMVLLRPISDRIRQSPEVISKANSEGSKLVFEGMDR